ncbi:DUF4367 domain-containing protein [Anaerotruncus colihominis]|uniref:DUF4367 domain-containing protein n=1 Tax=Anaerotruncus colihominis TaxID=169435 RepID=UPI003996C920
MRLDDDLLTRALRESRDRTLSECPPAGEPEHVFSEDFERQMCALIRSQQRFTWRKHLRAAARRAAVFVLAAFVGLSACMLSVDAWRDKLYEMVEEKHPEYSNISYRPVDGSEMDSQPDFKLIEYRPSYLPDGMLSVDAWRDKLYEMVEEKHPEYSNISYRPVDGSEMDSQPDFKLIEYRPSYLPDGYFLTSQMLDEYVNWSTYESPDGGFISFDQAIIGVPGVAINTEGAQLEKFDLNGETAYKMDNKGSQFVLWNDSRYQYMVITQNMPMEEAVRIAESVTVCPADAPHPPQLTPKFGPPLDYPKDQAAANGDIVISGGEIENLSRLNAFFDEMASQKQTIIRVTDYDQGGPRILELYFNGLRVDCTEDDTRTPGKPKNTTSGYTYERMERVVQDGDIVVLAEDRNGGQMELFRYRQPE